MIGNSKTKNQKSKIKVFADTFINHPLFAGSFIMIFGSNAVSFLNYLYHVAMVRMLGPANYGELAAIISLIGLLGIIPGSLNLVIIKYVSSAKDDSEISALINWLKTKIFAGSLIFSFLILITSPLISSFLNINTLLYLFLVAITFFFSTQSLFNRSILQGLIKFKEMVMSMLAENGIKIVLSIFLVYLGFSVGGAMISFSIAALAGWFITNLFLNYRNKHTEVKINIKQIISFTIPVLIQSFAITSLYSSDVILVKHFFSSYDAGIYASLSTLGKIIFFGAGPIGAVMFPLVSRKNAKKENHTRIFTYSFLATILLSVGVLFIYWFFPEVAIKLLFGTAYLKASGLLVWFGLFISLFTLSALLISYGLALGKTSIVFLPLVAAISQVIMIWFYHQSLFIVILISTVICTLLLLLLLIYLSFNKRKYGDKFNFNNSTGF